MKIAIEDVLKLDSERASINMQPITLIEWTYRGEVIPIDVSVLQHHLYTGLNNTDFVHAWLPQLLGLEEWPVENADEE